MAKRRRSGGEGRPPRSVREGQEFVASIVPTGRPGADRTQNDDRVTHRTGITGTSPEGRKTLVRRGLDVSGQRSLEMENSAAEKLAAKGWRIKQNPTSDEVTRARQEAGDRGSPLTAPDFLLEGRVFDCYSPTNSLKTPRGIWRYVQQEKIDALQTQRVVINLEDWRGDLSALRAQFAGWPMEGLKEVKVITADGGILQLDLPPAVE